MIGIARDMFQNCSMLRIPFEPGDRLIMYTDGLTEAESPSGEMLDVKGLRGLFEDTVHLSLEDSVSDIVNRLEAFRGGLPAPDDQLLLSLAFSAGTILPAKRTERG